MTKLDAAIDILKMEEERGFHYYEAAIRILEAAAKVDKKACLSEFNQWFPVVLPTFPAIHDLLAALPDPEEGK